MKKAIMFLTAIFMMAGLTAFSQAVTDRNVVPVAVNLNQVLRMTISNGGNIEFVFNTIDDYKNGLSALAASASDDMYLTDFTVSSSTRWKLTYGAEEATFMGTDDPGNTLALDNVGFSITETGAHVFEAAAGGKGTTVGAQLYSDPTYDGTLVTGLEVYPIVLIEDNDSPIDANAGDATDNSFTLNWRCGTEEVDVVPTPMNAVNLLDQTPSPNPDRYIVNVLFELAID